MVSRNAQNRDGSFFDEKPKEDVITLCEKYLSIYSGLAVVGYAHVISIGVLLLS